MNRILKVADNLLARWFRVAAQGAIAVTYAWYWLRFFRTPDEHRREAERRRREDPDHAKAQASATKHEQIATFTETAEARRSVWWSLCFVVAMFALYAFVHSYWPT